LRITNPLALRARVVNCALGTYRVFIKSVAIENLNGGSLEW
jgi:hypothetical protein